MIRKLLILCGISALLICSIAGCGSNNNLTASQNTGGSQNTGNIISEEEAKTAALKDAGVNEADVTGLRIHFETDDGVQEYEVDFYVGNMEYDYEIDASTGDVLSKDMDIEDDFQQHANSTDTGSAPITETQAKEIALERVPGAQESDIQIHSDNDDGRQIYEGTITYNETEYDFEIDASDGRILEWEAESIHE